MFARFRSFVRGLFRRHRFESAMSDELRFHIDAFTEDLIRSGIPRDEAMRRARVEFGGVESVKEECRQARGLWLADELRQDLRYGVRTMVKAPVVTLAVIVSLALGFGANTALFGFIDAVFLRTLPVRSPHELFYLAHHSGPESSSNYPLYERYGGVDAFAGLTAYQTGTFRVAVADAVEPVTGQVVSGNYHTVVGIPMALGRGFQSEPDRDVSRASIVVISDAYWARVFGRSSRAVGSTITVNGRPAEIVGVTAPGFYGLDSQMRVDITLPLSVVGLDRPDFFDDHGSWMGMRLVGRLKPDVTEAQALAAADIVFQQFMREPEQQWVLAGPGRDRFRSAALLPAAWGSEGRRELVEKPIRVLVTMAGILLLIACANVANLLLVRGASRRREVAVRAGIGASRSRLIRQFATEGLLLALCGGLLGLPVAAWTSGAILSLLDAGPTPFLLDVTLNARSLAFALLIATLTGLGFALLPAIRATADVVALAPALKTDAGARRGRVTGGYVLVASQIALCLLLLVAAGLLARSLFNLKTVQAGFERKQLILANVNMTGPEFSPDRRLILYDSLLERIRLLPGVLSVSSSTRTPIDLSSRNQKIVIPGVNIQGFHAVSPNVVSSGYFRTLGIRLVRGRDFTRDDRADRPRVAVVSESMARFYFGNADPLGRTIMQGGDDPITIVGVAADVRHEQLTEPAAPKMVFMALSQTKDTADPFAGNAVPARITLVAQVTADPLAIGAAMQAEARRLDRGAMVSYVRTMDQQLDAALVRERLLAVLSSGISALALLLACVGLYGTLSYTVVRRSREIGIRMALGAARMTVLGQILRQSLIMATCGVVAGCAAALWASRALSAFLFELSPRDPLTLTAAIVCLLVTAAAAGFVPARRAASVDPARVLRTE